MKGSLKNGIRVEMNNETMEELANKIKVIKMFS